MGYLRLVRSGEPVRGSLTDCLDAFDRELEYLFALLQRFGACSTEMEDLLQEIFVVFDRHWPTLDTGRPLRPWLFGVAFRVVRSHRRRRAREILTDEIVIEDPAGNPEAILQDQQSLRMFYAGLDHVPAARRSVVIMHDVEGVEVVDIARRLDMTKFGVYTRLYKGRKELASALRRLLRAAEWG